MAHEITVPKLGDLVSEGTIEHWIKKEGDFVSKGDVLVQIESQKATIDIESPFEGYLLKVSLKEGEVVTVGTVICYIGEEGEQL